MGIGGRSGRLGGHWKSFFHVDWVESQAGQIRATDSVLAIGFSLDDAEPARLMQSSTAAQTRG